MRDLINANALDLIIETVEAGTTPDEARAWWVSYLSQKANESGVELDALPVTPANVARVVALIGEGKLTNKLGRQAIDGVLAGEVMLMRSSPPAALRSCVMTVLSKRPWMMHLPPIRISWRSTVPVTPRSPVPSLVP